MNDSFQKLTLKDFKEEKIEGVNVPIFFHFLKNGDKMCLEPCFGGFCVARYDKRLELVRPKICTNMKGFLNNPGHASMRDIYDAFDKAIDIANTML